MTYAVVAYALAALIWIAYLASLRARGSRAAGHGTRVEERTAGAPR